MCDGLKTEDARYQCGHAVIMDPGHISAGKNIVIPEDVVSFCGKINEIYRESCYQFGGFLNYARTRDIERSIGTCRVYPNLGVNIAAKD